MSSTEDHSGVQRQKKGKWKRSNQVCTNCRQGKNRCDFQERFPDPCSRCVAQGDTRPCYVDPAFKRRNVRKKPDEVPQDTSHSQDLITPQPTPSPDESGSSTFRASAPAPAPAAPEPALTAPALGASRHPPGAVPFSPSPDRVCGSVHLSGFEIDALFDEYFTYYHPHLPLLPSTLSPLSTFSTSPLLFWTLCGVASRPRPGHPIPRARDPALCLAIGRETKEMIAQCFIAPPRNVQAVQALLVHCEWPISSRPVRGEDVCWFYSGLALQLALSLGLHRPHFAREFCLAIQLSADELRERTSTWAHCFIIHQDIASMLGLPSCVSDDWVTASASHPSTAAADPLISLDPDVSKLLRIQRFALRLSTVMGHSVRSKSGQDASTGPALIGILASELVDIENGLSPMNPRVAIAFLEVKLQLYTYGLQDDMMLASPMDLLSCYTSSIRMLEILHKLAAAPDTNAAFWPRSMLLSTVYATLCLLKLASLQTTHPQKFTVDRNMILREIMRAYDLLKGRSLTPGDEADQVCQIIRFLSRRLANSPPSSSTTSTSSTPAAPPKRPAMYVRARMSLGGLLYDAVYETIIAGPWGAKLQPGALRTLPGAAGCCGLTDADETVEREERERAETQAQVRAQPVVPQVAGMQAAPTVHAAAQELPMLSTSTSDLDVFGWLNGMDTTSYDELINDVANFGAFGTSWMMGDLSAMQMG